MKGFLSNENNFKFNYYHMNELYSSIIDLLKKQTPPLRIRKSKDDMAEFCGTKERMQGKQKVDGYYFGSVVLKPKDVRLYFFPIYTHVDHFKLSDNLNKMLKGKSCFHLKNVDQDLLNEIDEMIQKGVKLYQKDDLI